MQNLNRSHYPDAITYNCAAHKFGKIHPKPFGMLLQKILATKSNPKKDWMFDKMLYLRGKSGLRK